jgi:hypothetical protein
LAQKVHSTYPVLTTGRLKVATILSLEVSKEFEKIFILERISFFESDTGDVNFARIYIFFFKIILESLRII